LKEHQHGWLAGLGLHSMERTMPDERYSFSENADASGRVKIVKDTHTGMFRVTIRSIQVVTRNGCRGRDHQVSLEVNRSTVLQDRVSDCQVYRRDVNQSWRGHVAIELVAEGFDPGELVMGESLISYDLNLF
jgi:hypothetical protein